MKTLKKKTCPSLSGNSKVSYEIGVAHDQSLALRLVKSSGGGFVSKSWLAMSDIMTTLKGAKPPFTSYVLHRHFKGRSVNSLSFMMAVLWNEALVIPDKEKPLAFVIDDLDKAVAEFEKAYLATSTKRKPSPKRAVSQ